MFYTLTLQHNKLMFYSNNILLEKIMFGSCYLEIVL